MHIRCRRPWPAASCNKWFNAGLRGRTGTVAAGATVPAARCRSDPVQRRTHPHASISRNNRSPSASIHHPAHPSQ
eukprot:3441931-Prymnesium_polylepis.1